MSLFFAPESDSLLSPAELRSGLFRALDDLGPRKRVLAIPPDFTRHHSLAGELTQAVWEYYGDGLVKILPALGTHRPMSDSEIGAMFGGIPRRLFEVHDWRQGVTEIGEIPADFIREQSEGALDFSCRVQIDRLLLEGDFDLILSIGQVVPHEVAGMAGHNKNVFIGAGGSEMIHKSHYLGAVYGMERIMGRADNPVRRVLNYAADRFAGSLPLVHVLTVIGNEGCALFVGDDLECFQRASELSLRLNFILLDSPIQKAVVYLDPATFHSTWLGNKAIYRTRMAIADGGELIVLAPGVERFGEDATIDGLIRKYGYRGTPAVLRAVREHADLAAHLSAAAHLIHGSSEGRFTITYCPGHLGRKEVEGVGFGYAPLESMREFYDPARLRTGWHHVGGEEVYFIANPALGLWAHRGARTPGCRVGTHADARV